MRDQGRLVEWFDDKGYGFIQPNDAHKDRVFIHIKDFARTGPRPIVGCALEYTVILDERGRYRAQQVTYLKASQVIEHRAEPLVWAPGRADCRAARLVGAGPAHDAGVPAGGVALRRQHRLSRRADAEDRSAVPT